MQVMVDFNRFLFIFSDQEDLDHDPDHVIATGRIAKDVAPDLGIGKTGHGKDLDPDLNPGKGDLEEMNLGKGLEKRKEGKIKNAKIGIDLKGITKKMTRVDPKIQCLLKKLTRCGLHLVYHH